MCAGVTTRLTFTPAYAPPETLQALADGNRTTEATAAADVWVIGVIAFELATKHAAFPSNVRSCLKTQFLSLPPPSSFPHPYHCMAMITMACNGLRMAASFVFLTLD